MDLRLLRSGELLTGAGALALLAAMFLPWFGGRSAWETMAIGRLALALTALLALALVVITARRRAVSLATSWASITVAVATLALLVLVYRVGIDEPGPNGATSVDVGAYLGLACLLALLAGTWRALADERTAAAPSRRQTERVLAVRGTPRPPPPARAAGRRPRD